MWRLYQKWPILKISLFQKSAYFKNWPILKSGLFQNFCRRHNCKRDVFFEKNAKTFENALYKQIEVKKIGTHWENYKGTNLWYKVPAFGFQDTPSIWLMTSPWAQILTLWHKRKSKIFISWIANFWPIQFRFPLKKYINYFLIPKWNIFYIHPILFF